MYEARFGITGPPFQLNPDPDFYFDSRGHHQAVADLRLALASDSGFLIVSGDIGTGKTMIARRLVKELDPSMAVAEVVSTQLRADELLIAVSIAFGVPTQAATGDEPIVGLHRFLRKLDKAGRRALLIIDEAQNLREDAVLQLVALAGRQSQRRLPLEVCLIGQPELRTMIQAAALLPLRESIIASCHLGPIDCDETGAYIQRRLRQVGWTANPHFEEGAFEEIHRWTGGVPRLINLLCNRLMLSRFLAGSSTIDVAAVVETAQGIREEIGETDGKQLPGLHSNLPDSRRDERPERSPRPGPADAAIEPGSLLCVAAGHGDHVRAGALMHALRACGGLPAVHLVRAHDNAAMDLTRSLFDGLDMANAVIDLGIPEDLREGSMSDLTRTFESVIGRAQPKAVIVFSGSDVALACSKAAHRSEVPIVHIDAGLRGNSVLTAEFATRKSVDNLADLLCCADAQASAGLIHDGIPKERVRCVGSLLATALQIAREAQALPGLGDLAGDSLSSSSERNGYALVLLSQPANLGDRHLLTELLSMLRDVSRDIPLAWLETIRLATQLKRFRLDGLFSGERITMLPPQPYFDYVRLLRNATCVLTDSWSTQEEATALGIPCLTIGAFPERPITASVGTNTVVGLNRTLTARTIWDCIFNGGKPGHVPELWDGQAANRTAEYLSAWLADTSDRTPH